MTIEEILSLYKKNNWQIQNFNIFVLRNNRVFTDKFTDKIYWFYKEDSSYLNYKLKSAACTSKAGLYYVKNPLSKIGVAVLKEGQHLNSHILGKHKGEYEAFVQNSLLPVWRDNDKDDWIDYKVIELGSFGINIHRSNPTFESKSIGRYSAGCIVLSNPIAFSSLLSDFKKYKDNQTSIHCTVYLKPII